MAKHRLIQGKRNRTQSRQVNDLVDASHRRGTGFRLPNIPDHHLQPRCALRPDQSHDGLQILRRAAEMTVQNPHSLTQRQQLFHHVRSDESRSSGHQPLAGLKFQAILEL